MKETALFALYGDSYGEKFRQYEDRIKELEAQIEKMKCCGNCAEVCASMFGEGKECWQGGIPTKWRLKTR